MKFSDRSALERTAIDGWIRVTMALREKVYLKIADGFLATRRERISEMPGDLALMLSCYAAYQAGRHTVSYRDYFQVSHPEEYAAILDVERAAG